MNSKNILVTNEMTPIPSQKFEFNMSYTSDTSDNINKKKLILEEKINFKNGAKFENLDILLNFSNINIENKDAILFFRNCNLILEKKDYTISYQISLINCTVSEVGNLSFEISGPQKKIVFSNTNIVCKNLEITGFSFCRLNSTNLMQNSIICQNFINNYCTINILGYLIICSQKFTNLGMISLLSSQEITVDELQKSIKNISTIIANNFENYEGSQILCATNCNNSRIITSNNEYFSKRAYTDVIFCNKIVSNFEDLDV
jgi:hypothetical protein